MRLNVATGISCTLFGLFVADRVHADAQESEQNKLTEVIVTAEKKQERLQDVPIPVSVIDTSTLVQKNEVLIRDYFETVPGLLVTPNIESQQVLSIRGIGSTSGNPSVGLTIDGAPFGGSTQWGGLFIPDIDPGDLSRMEVLRGPQGTLYGANTLGGLINFITVDPTTNGFGGRVEAGTSGVYNGPAPGFNLRASANIPLSDTLAIRVSGYQRQDPGYIDNPSLNIRGINEAQAFGGHFSALWVPSENFSLKLSALYQHIRADGGSDANLVPGLGNYAQNFIAGAGKYDRVAQAYSAILTAKLGSIDLTSITGYNYIRDIDTLDFTPFIAQQAQELFGVDGSLIYTDQSNANFSQEIRLSSTIWQRVDWLLGGFYLHQNSPNYQNITATNPVTAETVGQFLYAQYAPNTYKELAGFINLTYRVTDRFDVQIGARESSIKQTSATELVGPDYPYLGGPSPVIFPLASLSENSFTYLLTPRFKLSPDLMVYARLASGYRPGGFNTGLGVPPQFSPDKTQNYEIGIKGDFFEHTLFVDASIFRVNWTNIQVALVNPQTESGYMGNAGEAKSEGVELSIQAHPLQGLKISAWADYDNAVLTQAFPAVNPLDPAGAVGDRVPNAARESGYISVEQTFPLQTTLKGFFAGSLSYTGDRIGSFGILSMPERQDFPGFAQVDLRTGIQSDSWTVTVFVTNLANKLGELQGGAQFYPTTAFVYITPRTYGVNAVKTF